MFECCKRVLLALRCRSQVLARVCELLILHVFEGCSRGFADSSAL